MHALSTWLFGSVARRSSVVPIFVALLSASIIADVNAVEARSRQLRLPIVVGTMPERSSVALLRPRHVSTPYLRPDRRGDSAASSTYYEITNITAEVGGYGGYAVAVNDDGRIGYSDFGNGEDVPGYAYIVNNGGTFGFLLSESNCDYGSTIVDGINENAEAVGYTVCDGTGNYIGWSLSGDVYSSILYFDQTYPVSYANAINDHEIAVGCIGSCYSGAPGSAVIIEASSTSNGRVIPLRGLKGRTCVSTASSINDAGTIVGSACDEAVRFFKAGYAQPLGLGRGSTAEAINQHGDIVGSAGSSAFLERDGKTLILPKPAPYGRYSATAYAVDAADEVVGDLFGPNDAEVPYLYARGHAYALNSLLPPHSGWTIVDALGINDHGEIVGDGYYNGTLYGVSLKPPH